MATEVVLPLLNDTRGLDIKIVSRKAEVLTLPSRSMAHLLRDQGSLSYRGNCSERVRDTSSANFLERPGFIIQGPSKVSAGRSLSLCR